MSEHEESAVWAAIDALPPQQRWPSQVRHLLAPQVPPPAASMDFDTIAESLCESHQRPAWRRWEFPSMTQGTPDDVSQLSISALDAYATPPQAEASALQTAARQTPAFGAPS
jgi:hypothetical protein